MFEGLKKGLGKIAGWFQPTYNKIKALELPPALDKLFDGLWDTLSPDIQKGLWLLVKKIYKDYGPEKAKDLLKVALDYLAKIFKTDSE